MQAFLNDLLLHACPSYEDEETSISTFRIDTCCCEWWVQAYVEFGEPIRVIQHEIIRYAGEFGEREQAPSWEAK